MKAETSRFRPFSQRIGHAKPPPQAVKEFICEGEPVLASRCTKPQRCTETAARSGEMDHFQHENSENRNRTM